jgi:hypothetical protein
VSHVPTKQAALTVIGITAGMFDPGTFFKV